MSSRRLEPIWIPERFVPQTVDDGIGRRMENWRAAGLLRGTMLSLLITAFTSRVSFLR